MLLNKLFPTIDIRYIFNNICNKLLFTASLHNVLIRIDRADVAENTLLVKGWAISRSGRQDIQGIEVYVDGTFVGKASYGIMRTDVQEVFPNVRESIESGFRLVRELPTGEEADNSRHIVQVKVCGAKGPVCSAQKTCTDKTLLQEFERLSLPSLSVYRSWYKLHKCAPNTLTKQKETVSAWEKRPFISIIIPSFNSPPKWFGALLQSIHQQSYSEWECIIVDDCSSKERHLEDVRNWQQKDSRFRFIRHEQNHGVSQACQTGLQEAQGDYICVVDHDDLLEPQAFFEFAGVIREKHPDIIYSDEMFVYEDGSMMRCEFRPDFNYFLLLSHPYIVHLTLIQRQLALKVGGFNPAFRISQDYDLLLRLAAETRNFYHIPQVLYRWRHHDDSSGHELKDKVMTASLKALNQHVGLAGFSRRDVWVQEGCYFNHFRLRHVISPIKLSIIILTRDQGGLLRTCLESFYALTHIPQGVELEFIIVDNGTTCPETLKYFDTLSSTDHHVLRIDTPFNFSALNNQAAQKAGGSLLLFMNNDIEIIETGWLEAMMELLMLPQVAIAGAKLLYPDNRIIQHAGVLVGCNGSAVHDHQFYPETESDDSLFPGHNNALLSIRECMAVTAACMMVRRSEFEAVGGFDEQLQVGYGDTDLCLRIQEETGAKVLFTPYARLLHHESASRGRVEAHYDPHPEDSRLFVRRWHTLIEQGDPFYNRNLIRDEQLFYPDLTSQECLERFDQTHGKQETVLVSFQCNVCGKLNTDIPLHLVNNRETPSCAGCNSSLRMRSIIHVLSTALFGKSLVLTEFPTDKRIVGMGMSDWEGYAELLEEKFSYTNTFYHTEPRLDITNIDDSSKNCYDFIISSDVFEHVPPPVSLAFANLYRLLKPGGLVIFTVPYKKDGVTDEYFPELHDFEICDREGEGTILLNKTTDGREQCFKNLTFHGGDGSTLEMRMFSEASLRREFKRAQFDSVTICAENVSRFGILWPIDWALPMIIQKGA